MIFVTDLFHFKEITDVINLKISINHLEQFSVHLAAFLIVVLVERIGKDSLKKHVPFLGNTRVFQK